MTLSDAAGFHRANAWNTSPASNSVIPAPPYSSATVAPSMP